MQNFKEICTKAGLRMTHQRFEIFKELLNHTGHPSSEEIFRQIRDRLPTISLDTVYRTVYIFEQCGILRRVQSLDDPIRFDPNLKVHHHLICQRCKKIDDVYWPEFETVGSPEEVENWGDIQIRQVEFRGLCRDCRRD